MPLQSFAPDAAGSVPGTAARANPEYADMGADATHSHGDVRECPDSKLRTDPPTEFRDKRAARKILRVAPPLDTPKSPRGLRPKGLESGELGNLDRSERGLEGQGPEKCGDAQGSACSGMPLRYLTP